MGHSIALWIFKNKVCPPFFCEQNWIPLTIGRVGRLHFQVLIKLWSAPSWYKGLVNPYAMIALFGQDFSNMAFCYKTTLYSSPRMGSPQMNQMIMGHTSITPNLLKISFLFWGKVTTVLHCKSMFLYNFVPTSTYTYMY